MSTFELTGIQIGENSEGVQPVKLTISLPTSANGQLSYDVIGGGGSGDEVPEADINFPAGSVVALGGVVISTGNTSPFEAYIGTVNWDENKSTDFLTIVFDDNDSEYLFELGGDTLPVFETQSEVDAFNARVSSVSAVETGDFRPNVLFDLDSVTSAEQVNGLDVSGSIEADTITGGSDDDVIAGRGGDDIIDGGEGNDVLRGGKQEDQLIGGSGDDKLFGQRHGDVLDGGDGNDRLNGGGGNDTLEGGEGDDFLKGGTRNDVLNGGDGNDDIYGNRGDDVLNGGDGNDVLNAGGGNDILNGGAGNDNLKGGADADTFIFANNHGTDVIRDFDATNDAEKIDFSDLSSIESFDQISGAASQNGADVLIDTGDGNSILLMDVNLGDLDANDFIF